MNKVIIDTHIHSDRSDGELAPEKIWQVAIEKRLAFFSITDHNIISKEVINISKQSWNQPVQCVQGVEISTLDRQSNLPLHVLGYARNFNYKQLNNSLAATRNGYDERAKKIISKLNIEYPSLNLTFANLKRGSRESYISRNTIAKKLQTHLDTNLSFKEMTKLAYVEDGSEWMMSPKDAIKLISSCGGVSVLAHPGKIFTKNPTLFDKILGRLIKNGLVGLEARYLSHKPDETEGLLVLAKRYKLIISAGSDWHGNTYTPDKNIGVTVSEGESAVFLESINRGELPKLPTNVI